MGSADPQFSLAEILTQNYSLQETCPVASRGPEQPAEELDKDFAAQVRGWGALPGAVTFLVIRTPAAGLVRAAPW